MIVTGTGYITHTLPKSQTIFFVAQKKLGREYKVVHLILPGKEQLTVKLKMISVSTKAVKTQQNML